MRDETMGGNGYGAPSNPGGRGWDNGGGYYDDPRSYAPPAGPGIPGQRDPRYAGAPEQAHTPEPAHVPAPGPRTAAAPGPGPATATSPTGGGHRAGGHRAGGDAGGHRRGGSRRLKKTGKRRVLKWVAIGTAVTVLATAGAAFGYYEYLSSQIRTGQRSSGSTNVAKPKANAKGKSAMNILILGSDTRNSADDVALGGGHSIQGQAARADVIMIAHLSADRTNMSVLSIPRDTRVDIPECTDPDTHKSYPKTNDIINSSLGRGGAGCTLATVQNLTGVYIDHWLTIDFSGVVKMADAVGGVEVCVRHNVDDHPTRLQPGGSHLHLKAGRQLVKGKVALQWLRTRHAFGSDAGRAQAQHMYMGSLIRKLRAQNLFTNPGRLNAIATTALKAFKVSSELGSPTALYDLGMQLKTVPPERITFLTMPRIADPQAPQAHYLPAPDADRVWSLLRNDIPLDANGKPKAPGAPGAPSGPGSAKPAAPPASQGPAAQAPGTIAVTVLNGTAGNANGVAVPHRAGGVAQALVAAGFTRAAAGQQPNPSPGTTLVYPASSGDQGKADAVSVAKALKIPAANVKASSTVQSITLTIGADWKSGTDFSLTLPKAGAVPVSAEATNGADKTKCMDVLPTYRW